MDLLLACKSALGIVVGDGVEQERSCTCAQMFDAGSKHTEWDWLYDHLSGDSKKKEPSLIGDGARAHISLIYPKSREFYWSLDSSANDVQQMYLKCPRGPVRARGRGISQWWDWWSYMNSGIPAHMYSRTAIHFQHIRPFHCDLRARSCKNKRRLRLSLIRSGRQGKANELYETWTHAYSCRVANHSLRAFLKLPRGRPLLNWSSSETRLSGLSLKKNPACETSRKHERWRMMKMWKTKRICETYFKRGSWRYDSEASAAPVVRAFRAKEFSK